MSENILTLHSIVKNYPGVKALDGVDFELKKGEVHALVGENGAGKSTIIKIIAGAITPNSGKIIVEGKEFSAMSPALAKECKIEVIYQELMLFNELCVAENIFFGREPKKGIFVDYKKMHREAKEIFAKIGLEIDTKTHIKNLGIAYQQIVEIGKAISRNGKILIMDEPSAPLTTREMKALYEIVKTLKAQGVSIIYISHRMEEIFDICDRVTVLRDGKYIATKDVKDTSRKELIKLMVGRALTETYPEKNSFTEQCALSVNNITNKKLRNVSFSLKKGEILGIGGLVGAGRTELARAIFGADSIDSGEIIIDGEKALISKPKNAINSGIGLIPEDRKQQGLLLELPIFNNITIASLDNFSKTPFVNKKRENEISNELCESLKVKTPSISQYVKNLSGGNQQKVVLAKWMAKNSNILIFDEPTRGIDVGARMEIYELMVEMTKQGKSIIMISSDMPELIGMSDRILVMRHGEITGELLGDNITQENILDLAASN